MMREEFKNLMIDKINMLLFENNNKKNPWTRRDFVLYIKGAADAFNLSDGSCDVDYLVADIFIDTVDAYTPRLQ